MKVRRASRLGGALCAALAPLIANAQNIVQAELTGQPLQYMQGGELSGCGVRIIGIDVASDLSSEASEVSINFYDSGRAVVKGVAYAKFSPGARSLSTLKVSSAWAKAPGSKATNPLGRAGLGDDKRALLYATDLAGALDIFRAQIDGKPIQIAVQREGQRNYRVMSGIVSLTPPEQEQLKSCMVELIGNIQRKSPVTPSTEKR